MAHVSPVALGSRDGPRLAWPVWFSLRVNRSCQHQPLNPCWAGRQRAHPVSHDENPGTDHAEQEPLQEPAAGSFSLP